MAEINRGLDEINCGLWDENALTSRIRNRLPMMSTLLKDASDVLPPSYYTYLEWQLVEWQVDHMIIPQISKFLSLNDSKDEKFFWIDQFAAILCFGILAPIISHAKVALYKFQSWSDLHIRAASTLSLLYIDERPENVDIDSLVEVAQDVNYTWLPATICQKVFENLVPIFAKNPTFGDILLKSAIREAGKSYRSLVFTKNLMIALGNAGVFREIVVYNLIEQTLNTLYDMPTPIMDYGERARKSLAFLVQNNDQALKMLTDQILKDWKETGETVTKISVFTEIAPEQASSEIIASVDKIVYSTESSVRVAAVQCLVHFANSPHATRQATQCILKKLRSDSWELRHKTLKGLWGLKEPDKKHKKIWQIVLDLAQFGDPTKDDKLFSLRAPAIEVLGKWGIITDSVMNVLQSALIDSLDKGGKEIVEIVQKEQLQEKVEIAYTELKQIDVYEELLKQHNTNLPEG
jgi:hypothetical protein